VRREHERLWSGKRVRVRPSCALPAAKA
jgi:hypothetical protein